MNDMKVKSCLLCGVGGQGTVLASRVLADAAMDKGLHAKTAETIGMAQRGGSVVSHVRIGNKISSPTIPEGSADVIVGFEPGEAASNLKYLRQGGAVILCNQEIKPVTASLGRSGYNGNNCIEFLKKNVEKCYIVDGAGICAKCGSSRVLNIALTGALCSSDMLDINVEEIEAVLKKRLKPELVEMNIKALHMGAESISQFVK